MESISILKFAGLPHIHTVIHSAEILSLKGEHTFGNDDFSHMFIMLLGSTSYELNSPDNTVNDGSFALNHIFIIPTGSKLKLNCSTQNCQLLHISFNLFEVNAINNENDSNKLYRHRKLQLLEECVPISSFEERYPYFQGDVHNLIMHCKMTPNFYKVLATTLETVLQTMLIVQISAASNVLKSIHGMAFENRHFEIKNSISLSVSDVTIWSDSPKENQNARQIARLYSQHTYIEAPGNKNLYTLEKYQDNDPKYGNYCDLTFNTSNTAKKFKFWQFAGIEIPPLDKYIRTGVISFRFKSDTTGMFTLYIYQLPGYKNISYTFEVTQKNVWIEFEIPFAKSSAFNVLPPYAEKAVRYIQENYAEKITIKDIANHINIHPSYLSAIFRKHLNQSVNSYINFHRINIAKQMLRNSDSSITDIALLTGFYDAQHFLKTFKKNTGLTPSEYRNML